MKVHKIINVMKSELEKQERTLVKIDKFLENAPVGCLKWQYKGGNIYYYQQYGEVEAEIKSEMEI